ncbi:SDR family NAD(P)-dependent oxidoreductase [Phaeovulum sp.]|uniref:SDR family NAD(P)-dependent oxidoreductase n=1 Tax=Phaeovulum sp. TaxID=2934796 RepID=UPI0027317964|nr:SDR family NAD(P)-dependent oxidoreductase [Phaeovulum sp.]MDP1668818.1 SDR family NAD(P)-dependent oxidoreductase [Phaeovulum sp.]MDZ4119548.1 SDR family NAD(P)-dependent oxidoreductase [Phaeovulum sp.]
MEGWALITGASQGIGQALAAEAAAAGWNLVISARGVAQLEAVAAELRARHGVQVTPAAFDLAEPSAAEALWAAALTASGGQIGVLVNNAGLGWHGAFGTSPEGGAQEAEVIAVNIRALTTLAQLAVAHMRAAGAGRVLNVASTAAFMPIPHMAVYGASKAFVLSLSEALAVDLAGSGVSVTVLCPGATDTGFFDRAGTGTMRLMKLLPMPKPEGVAQAGWRGMMAARRIVIPGAMNTLSAFGPRLLPRALAARLAGVFMARSR